MTPVALRRLLLVGAAVPLAGLAAVVLIAPALGFRWDPFDRADRRISDLETRLAHAEAAAAASTHLARAEADQAVRVDALLKRSGQRDPIGNLPRIEVAEKVGDDDLLAGAMRGGRQGTTQHR